MHLCYKFNIKEKLLNSMKVVLMSVGKTDDTSFAQIIDTYKNRLKFYISFELEYIPDLKKTKNLSQKEQKTLEGKTILNRIHSSDHIVLLDDKGIQYSSLDFAQFIEKRTHYVSKRIVFIIGGPYGFSEEIYNRANEKISLSKMTFTHQMVRLVFIEQLYRAMTILNNEPYHHE